MTTSSLVHGSLSVAREAPPVEAPAVSVARPSLALPGLLCALVAVAGGILVVTGGGLKPGAFNLLPREDGLFTAGVFAATAAFGQGLREHVALAVASPIVAISFYGILRFHQTPLALIGAELAFIGVIGLAFQQWRARYGKAT